MKDWGSSRASYIASCLYEARRCKTCPKPCILYTWARYPSEQKHHQAWFRWPGDRFKITNSYSKFIERMNKQRHPED